MGNNRNTQAKQNNKVVHLYEEATQQAVKIPRTLNWRKVTALLAGILLIGLSGGQLLQTLQASQENQAAYEAARASHQVAVEKNRKTQEEYQRVQSPDYLAEIARRDYYYSKPNEIIFEIGENITHNE
ncbi:hypothetical protein CL176_11335 [Suicoccus acidiformans]|uniref:Septum formation initiator n=1 Tax=Suicoccus acidiformans TaxID=2036206 RepID=A0A347WN83_9LACT|nr:septum formation initiator family protein [Suicoccus acidiformans]AXY26540.1 hypothetical protein CL176_11335 [Suicoccus acidiformans]